MSKEKDKLAVDEVVVLSKFDGEPEPENEFERTTVQNGTVVLHERIKNGQPVGPVEESEILGKNIGRLYPIDNIKEVK